MSRSTERKIFWTLFSLTCIITGFIFGMVSTSIKVGYNNEQQSIMTMGNRGVGWHESLVDETPLPRSLDQAMAEDIGGDPWHAVRGAGAVQAGGADGGYRSVNFGVFTDGASMGNSTDGGLCSMGLPVERLKNEGDQLVKGLVTAGHCVLNDNGEMYHVDGVAPDVIRLDNYDLARNGGGHIDYSVVDVKVGNYYNVLADYAEAGYDIPEDRVPVTGVKEPKVGEKVCAWGVKSTWRCGTILWVGENTFFTDFVSRPGDSGGGVFAGNDAMGILTATTTIGNNMWVSEVQRMDAIMGSQKNIVMGNGVN